MTAAEERGDRGLRVAMGVFAFLIAPVMTPITADPAQDIKVLLYHLAGAGLIVAMLALRWLMGTPLRPPGIFGPVLGAWFALDIVAGLASAHRGNSLEEISKMASLLALYLVASQIYRTPSQVERLMMCFCAGVGLSSIYAFFQKAGLDPFPWDPGQLDSDSYRELPGTFGNPNLAAHAMVLCIVMAVYFLVNRRWWIGSLCLAVFSAHLYLTGQRAGMVALAGAILLWGVARWAPWRRMTPERQAMATIAATGLLCAVAAAAVMGAYYIRTGSPFPLDTALLLRYMSYVSSSAMILSRPFLGFGPGNYAIDNPPFWTPFEQRWFAEKWMLNGNVHHEILETTIETGIPGGLLFAAFLVAGMAAGLTMARAHPDRAGRRLGAAMGAIFSVFLVDGFFGFNFRSPVTAVMIMCLAGALDGTWTASGPTSSIRKIRVHWPFAIAGALAFANAAFGGAAFASQYCLQQGRSLVTLKAYDRAELVLALGERLAPWNGVFGFHRGRAALLGKKPELAEQHLERGLALTPHYLPMRLQLVRAQIAIGVKPGQESRLEDAEKNVRAALGVCPVLAQGEELLGRIALLRASRMNAPPGDGAWTEAERHLEDAVRLGSTQQDDIWTMLASVRISHERLGDAEEAIRRAAQVSPGSDKAWGMYFDLSTRLDRFDPMRLMLKRTIGRLSADKSHRGDFLARAYFWEGRLHEQGLRDPRAAEASFRSAVNEDPSKTDAWAHYAGQAVEQGHMKQFRADALRAFERLSAPGKTPLPGLTLLAGVWRDGPAVLPRTTAYMVEQLSKRDLASDMAGAVTEFGWVTEILAAELKDAPESTPDLGLATLNIGVLYKKFQELDRADEHFVRALGLLRSDQERLACIQHRTEMLLARERFADLEKYLGEHLSLADRNAYLAEARATALARNGKTTEARLAYMTLLQSFKLTDVKRADIQRAMTALAPPPKTG